MQREQRTNSNLSVVDYLVLPNLSTGLNQQCMCGDSTCNGECRII